MNAMRSRCCGSILACTLKTKPVTSARSGETGPGSAGCGRGPGAWRASASISSPTPKSFSAEPKYTGVWSPARYASASKAPYPPSASSASSRSLARPVGDSTPASAGSSSPVNCAALPRYSRLPPSGCISWLVYKSYTPSNSPPMPTGQLIGVTSSASISAISSSSSNAPRPSRSTLFTKVMIGTDRNRHTSNSLRVCASMPRAASITITAESTAVSVR